MSVRLEGYVSTSVSQARLAAIERELKASGLRPPERWGAYMQESAEGAGAVIWFALGVLASETLKPTGRVAGEALRDGLLALIDALRRLGREGEFQGVELQDENGKTVARYWLPAGSERDAALSSLDEHFRDHATGDQDRRWYPGRGWVTDSEMWREMQKEERPPDPLA